MGGEWTKASSWSDVAEVDVSKGDQPSPVVELAHADVFIWDWSQAVRTDRCTRFTSLCPVFREIPYSRHKPSFAHQLEAER